jgi:hypothetical protein
VRTTSSAETAANAPTRPARIRLLIDPRNPTLL